MEMVKMPGSGKHKFTVESFASGSGERTYLDFGGGQFIKTETQVITGRVFIYSRHSVDMKYLTEAPEDIGRYDIIDLFARHWEPSFDQTKIRRDVQIETVRTTSDGVVLLINADSPSSYEMSMTITRPWRVEGTTPQMWVEISYRTEDPEEMSDSETV